MSTDLSKISQSEDLAFSFAEVEAALSSAQNIANAKRTSFQARLKNFLKIGLLPDVPAGRGRAAAYSPWNLFVLGLAVEMSQLGLSPTRVKLVIDSNMWRICQAAMMAARQGVPTHGFELPMTISFDPRGLAELGSGPQDQDMADVTFNYAGAGQLNENLSGWLKHGLNRVSIISVSALLWDVASYTDPDRADEFYLSVIREAERVQALEEEGE
jgi:hypothetical protein